MTPEETRYVRKQVDGMLKAESDERVEHTKALVRAAGARLLI